MLSEKVVVRLDSQYWIDKFFATLISTYRLNLINLKTLWCYLWLRQSINMERTIGVLVVLCAASLSVGYCDNVTSQIDENELGMKV